jgi:hypothetical protein
MWWVWTEAARSSADGTSPTVQPGKAIAAERDMNETAGARRREPVLERLPSATPVAKRAVDTSTNGCVDVPHAGPGVAQNENATMGHAPTSVADAGQRADR